MASPPRGGAFVPEPPPPPPPPIRAACTTAKASEDLRPRADLTAVSMGTTGQTTQTVRTADLFARFNAICGMCHVAAANGGKHLDDQTFATVFDQTWLAAIQSDDVKTCMPPPATGKVCADRRGAPDMVDLVTNLEAWLGQGSPADTYVMVDKSSGSGRTADYSFTPDVASAMSNLGNCVPNKQAYATSSGGFMETMDAFFQAADALPTNLADTDLTTFDSEVLASTGVIAYVPTYPLWSDGSGKLRHIRVPRGQAVKFDKAAQTFDIPVNTRFYKTFFRKVVDRTGQLRNRKMETRLIVARPAQTLPDGTIQQTALFGSYIWSDDETTATLGTLRYRNGDLFADQTLTYYTDELTFQEITDSIGPGAQYKAALDKAVAAVPGLLQHYAVPGSLRCQQCHMGSPTKDFVLGFFPLQVARRANGTGGTYEPTGDDELNQLQRLIDYGVISGMTSPADVLPLEDSQGSRKKRTDEELTAQAYMIGNCAHCHNPRGFPSISKPPLATALNFMPDATDGGIFEFPLERMSPIRSRGANGDVPIPYITPSLRDYPVVDRSLNRLDNGIPITLGLYTDPQGLAGNGQATWTPKYNPNSCAVGGNDALHRAYCGSATTGEGFVPAPWRSLIYRNVDSPFPYFDDFVPFPHMPMHTPGFDCRAPRIMGEWMVGLPAARKKPEFSEDIIPRQADHPGEESYDHSPQPYKQVRPDDPGYAQALSDAKDRLDEYRNGVRYGYCQDVLGVDIFDAIPEDPLYRGYRPNPDRFHLSGVPPFDPTRPGEFVQPPIGVPYHGNWYSFDPTDDPPPWQPRRSNWKDLLVDRVDDTAIPDGEIKVTDDVKHARRVLIDAIDQATLTPELLSYATTEVPLGLWQTDPACTAKLASQKKISDFAGKGWQWIDGQTLPADAPVYTSAPGATLYRHICFNCHGPNADGKGLQADLLAALSDGNVRPANFKEGLFGPSSHPGANLMQAFGVPATGSLTGLDPMVWGPRYMAWMTLGGTLARIPTEIIAQVETTTVLGAPRTNTFYLPDAAQTTANMLNLAKGLCAVILPDPDPAFFYYAKYGAFDPTNYPPYTARGAPLIATNGDREMWLTLCTRFSPRVVRVYRPHDNDSQLLGLYYADSYPLNAPVFDQDRKVRYGVPAQPAPGQVDNYYPACFERSTNDATPGPPGMPNCPPGFVATGRRLWDANIDDPTVTSDEVTKWKLSGASAAGMAVFSYLNGGGAQTPVKPYYNECNLLP